MQLTVTAGLAVAFLFLAQVSVSDAQEYPSHLSSDPRVNDARTMVESGRLSEALSILRPLASGHADQTDVLFLIGLASVGLSQLADTAEQERTALLDEAIAAFHAILVERPELVRVRLELARAFYLKGDDDLSREHFRRVLAGSPPPAMAANIHRFLAVMRARRGWSGYFGFTLAPDSNINSAPNTEVIYINRLPFRFDDSAGAHSGVGVVLWGGGEYRFPLHQRKQLRTGVDVALTEYVGSQFDQAVLSAHVGPRWLLDTSTDLSLLGSVRRRWAAGNPHSWELGGRVEIDHRFSRRFTGQARLSYHRRKHDQNKALNGPHTTLSLGGIWLITPTLQANAAVGYGKERPLTQVWRNSTRWVRIGLTSALRKGFTAGVSVEVRLTDYEGRWAPFTPSGSSRKDQTRNFRFSLLNRALTVLGFSPKLVLVNEVRDSNAQAYDYRRNRAEVQFVRQF